MPVARTLSLYIARHFLAWFGAVFGTMIGIAFLLDYIELLRRAGSREQATWAVLLEMAAAREWGDAAYDRLDHLTFSLSPPDATSGLLAGSGDFNAAFTVPPYQNIQLRNPAVHTVITSVDIIGPASGGMAWATKRFHDANPTVYRAVLDAMQEASAFIAAHPDETAAYYVADSNGRVEQALMQQLLDDPAFKYILTPHGTMKWAAFMAKVGRIKVAPASWKDLFWPELHDRDGD